jgi:hypothetical protein
MPAQALAVVATLVSFVPHGNHVDLKLDRGSAEFVWTSPSAFHFRRTLEGPLRLYAIPDRSDPVSFRAEDTAAALHLRSKSLDVAIQKSGLLVKVSGPDGAVLMADLTEPNRMAGVWPGNGKRRPACDSTGSAESTIPRWTCAAKRSIR